MKHGRLDQIGHSEKQQCNYKPTSRIDKRTRELKRTAIQDISMVLMINTLPDLADNDLSEMRTDQRLLTFTRSKQFQHRVQTQSMIYTYSTTTKQVSFFTFLPPIPHPSHMRRNKQKTLTFKITPPIPRKKNPTYLILSVAYIKWSYTKENKP